MLVGVGLFDIYAGLSKNEEGNFFSVIGVTMLSKGENGLGWTMKQKEA